MDNSQDIQEIELSIEQARTVVTFGEALERLLRNRDFQLVIDQGYMTDEARRLTLLLGDPNINEQQRTAVTHSLRAIGELHQFFQVKRHLAQQMAKDLEMATEALDEIRADEVEAE